MRLLTRLYMILLISAISFSIQGQARQARLVKIPDAKFLTYLKAKIPGAFTGDEMNIYSEEVRTLTRINVLNKKVVSFEGIGYFTNLEEFNCTYNLATTLDLSKNKKLKYLVCWENRLTSLDLSQNPELRALNCGDNQITSLNVSGCPKLRELYCEYNRLKQVDLSRNPELATLYCNNNQLTTLNLSKNLKLEQLECAGNVLSKVAPTPLLAEIPDLQFRKWLKEKMPNAFAGELLNTRHNNVVYAKSIEVPSKNIVSLTGIAYFTHLEKLDCSDNKLSSLDLSHNTALTTVRLDHNPLVSLDLRGMRHIEQLSDLSDNLTISTMKLHRKLRDDARIIKLKQKRGKTITISVYSAPAGSALYTLVNSNDIPVTMDARYRNNS